jgi:hypothetical protein
LTLQEAAFGALFSRKVASGRIGTKGGEPMFTDWRDDLGTETATATDGHYDVRKAKQILKAHPRECVEVELTQFEDLLKRLAGCSYSGVDTNVPLILIPVGDRKEPIDGWSRIRKAKEAGRSSLFAVVLTAEEKEAIRLV